MSLELSVLSSEGTINSLLSSASLQGWSCAGVGVFMASGGGQDDGGIPLDIDNVHMLLQGQSISVLLCAALACDVL